MSSGLELYESRIDRIDVTKDAITIHFSHAYIHQSSGKPGRSPGTGWSREASLTLLNAIAVTPLPPLPNSIAGGYLKVGGIKHEVIPLPFQRKVDAQLYLQLADGTEVNVYGSKPFIELLGTPIFLEDF